MALVGASGGCKSSIIKLIERLYEPEDGIFWMIQHNLCIYKFTFVYLFRVIHTIDRLYVYID